MKSGLATYDEHGNACRPVWDGQKWRYFAVEYQPSERPDRVREKAFVEREEPFPLPARPVQAGWETVLFFFRDDGGNPDPRPWKQDPSTSLPLRVRYRNDAGRPRNADDLVRDFGFLRRAKTNEQRERLQSVSSPTYGTLAEVENRPEVTHLDAELVDQSTDLLAILREASPRIEVCCDCGPDEECSMPEGFVG